MHTQQQIEIARKNFENALNVVRREYDNDLSCGRLTDTEYSVLFNLTATLQLNTDNRHVTFSLDNAQHIAYSPDNVDAYDYSRRRHMRLSRYIARHMKDIDGLTDKLRDAFCERVMSHSGNPDLFRIVRGDDVVTAYRNRTGCGSCMTHSDSPVELYAENDDVVSMLIYENGSACARALLWHADNGDVVMDRVYSTDNSVCLPIMRQYAVSNGWVYRNSNSASCCELSNGAIYEFVLSSSSQRWPYMDTFIYATGSSRRATVTNSCYRDYDVVLNDTEGAFGDDEPEHIERCSHCECVVDTEYGSYETVYDNIYCDDCCNDLFTWSAIEETYLDNGDVVMLSDLDYDNAVSSRYARDWCIRCECCDEWFSDNATMHDTHSGDVVCDECRDNEYVLCNECDELFHCDDTTQTAQHDTLCCECAVDCDECGYTFAQSQLTDGLCVECAECVENMETENDNATTTTQPHPQWIAEFNVVDCRECRYGHTCQHSTLTDSQRLYASPIYRQTAQRADDTITRAVQSLRDG